MDKIIVLTVLCIFFIEFIVRSPFFKNLKAVMAVSKKAAAVITSKNISDHWKEKSLPVYSAKIMTSSIVMLLILSALIVVIYLVYMFQPTYYTFFSSTAGLLTATIFSIAYAKLRFGNPLKK